MYSGRIGTAFVAVLAMVAVAGAEDTASAGDAAAGKQTYDEICITCHAADGKGNGGLTGGNFVDDKSRLAQSDAELIEIVKNGKEGKIGMMPALGKVLSDKQIRDAIAYIRVTFGG